MVVITGASDGIGKQIALRLAKEGTRLALVARNEKNLNEVCEEAQKLGVKDVKAYSCDIRQTGKLKEVAEKILSDFGNVDVLINGAGVWQKLDPLEKISEETVDEVIQTNLMALIHLTRLLLPNLKSRPESAIINISSKSGVVAQEGQAIYTASKYGVRGFTEVLEVDLKNTPVRVAGVYQSGTNTKMFEKAGDTLPLEKFTSPSDLADVIAYMLSLPKKIWLYEVRVKY